MSFRRIVLVFSILIFGFLLWNIYTLFDGFKKQEEVKMHILAEAYIQFNQVTPEEDISLITKIIENNNSIPMIVTDSEGNVLLDQNITYTKRSKEKVLEKKLEQMKEYHEPIKISISKDDYQNIYYAPSEILNRLKFYPLTLIFVFFVFVAVVYAVFNYSSLAEKNKLWNGMAKETAHQIGTPLSSLLGWVAILKTEKIDQTYVDEIEKDVHHLNVIADRFSKIGSLPKLERYNLSEIIEETIAYYKTRVSKNVVFAFENTGTENIEILLNKELIIWVLENIFKNAIDAMQGKGNISVELKEGNKYLELTITDTGKGIPKTTQKKIFEPGFTTKTRGWGLGLSLSKRIISQYHNGKIFIKNSQKNIGTTFQVNFNKL